MFLCFSSCGVDMYFSLIGELRCNRPSSPQSVLRLRRVVWLAALVAVRVVSTKRAISIVSVPLVEYCCAVESHRRLQGFPVTSCSCLARLSHFAENCGLRHHCAVRFVWGLNISTTSPNKPLFVFRRLLAVCRLFVTWSLRRSFQRRNLLVSSLCFGNCIFPLMNCFGLCRYVVA